MKSHWEDKLKHILEKHDGIFGHNTEVDIKKYLQRIECIGGAPETPIVQIEIVDYYTVKIVLPPASYDYIEFRSDVLLFILTTSPMPTECRFNHKKDQLTIEWHY